MVPMGSGRGGYANRRPRRADLNKKKPLGGESSG
jgi:hypothetical protein